MQKSWKLLGRTEVQDYWARGRIISQNRLFRLREGTLAMYLEVFFLEISVVKSFDWLRLQLGSNFTGRTLD